MSEQLLHSFIDLWIYLCEKSYKIPIFSLLYNLSLSGGPTQSPSLHSLNFSVLQILFFIFQPTPFRPVTQNLSPPWPAPHWKSYIPTSHLLTFHTWPWTSSPIQISPPSSVWLVEFASKPLTSTSLFCCTFFPHLQSTSLWQLRVRRAFLPLNGICEARYRLWWHCCQMERSHSQPSLLHLSYRGAHSVPSGKSPWKGEDTPLFFLPPLSCPLRWLVLRQPSWPIKES